MSTGEGTRAAGAAAAAGAGAGAGAGTGAGDGAGAGPTPDRAVLAELRAIFAQQQEAAGAKVRAQGALAAAQAKVDTFGAESELSGDEKDALAAAKQAVVEWACQIELHSKRIAQLDEERTYVLEGGRDERKIRASIAAKEAAIAAERAAIAEERKIRAYIAAEQAAIAAERAAIAAEQAAIAGQARQAYIKVPQLHLADEHAAAATAGATTAHPVPAALSVDPVDSSYGVYFLALQALSKMNSTALTQAFPFEAGAVWQVGKIRILIREHFPALFRSMCRKANVQNMGVDDARGGHALLRGTAGTGKTYFMLVMFIQFLKMMRAASTVRKDSEHQVFTGAVTSILLKWDLVNGGQTILFDASPSAGAEYARLHRVHLYDAGTNLVQLPDPQGDGFYLATASSDPRHYSAWDSKACVAKQYSVLWSPSELLHLAEWEGISKDELGDRVAVVGGVPRLILSHTAGTLQQIVRERLAGVTIPQVRAIIGHPARDDNAVKDMLRSVDDKLSFSLFALEVEAEGDFDNVQVKFLSKYVCTEFFKLARERTVTEVLGELRAAIQGGSGLAGGTFEDWSVYELSKYGISGQMVVLSDNGAFTVAQLDLEPCDTIRYFMDADHLEVLVGRHGASAMYLPVAANDPLVDAWCVCTITCGDPPELVVAGCQMTVARTSHATTGKLEAKKQFEAIHRALVARGERIAVSQSPWVIWVLPAMNFSRFPFQHAKGGGPPGSDWPFQQGKIGMLLDEEGRTPASMEDYRSMLAETTTIELFSSEPGAVAKLHNIGQRTAPMLVDAVMRCTTKLNSSGSADEAKAGEVGNPCDAFLELLEKESLSYVRTLRHPRNWGKWTYQGHTPTCIDTEVKSTLEGPGRPSKRPRSGNSSVSGAAHVVDN